MKDLLYLKDEQIKEFIQLLYDAYRETFSDPKDVLSKKFFGPAHLRALNLIERNPGINLGELIFRLKVTKQSLNRVVRDLLKAGDFKEAEKMLGHKWLIKGTVVSGDKRGREIGFPTANLEVNDFLQINFGVYAVKVEIDGMSYNGVSNYGIRPTFDGEKLLLETYLFDFSKDIYGKDIVVSFIEFIRKEKKFDGIDLLKEQIALDSKKAIKILDK